MREMKDSGIEWIGKIPEDWKVGRVKDIFIRKNEKADEEDPIVLSLTRSGVKIRDISTGEGQLAESYKNYNPVEIDDFLLNPMDLYSGANCSISRVRGVISPAYINLRAKGYNNPAYYDYYFKTQYWGMVLFSFGKGVSYKNRWTLGLDTALNYFIPIPPIPEQQKIAQFLDNKVATIDNIIDKTKETIEDYKKYKQSLITEVVTKGLDKNAEMKDSGVEWIGKIPNSWEALPVNTCFKERNEKVSDKEWEPLSVTKYGIVRQLETAAKSDAHDARKMVCKNDFVINSRSDRKQSCGVSAFNGSVSLINIVLENKKLYISFIKYVLNNYGFAEEFYKYGSGIVADLWSTNYQKMKKIMLPIPPVSEQQNIAQFLDKQCTTIDNIISAKQSIIDELEQYKRSLIYEYVTGKKEVR